MRQLNEIIGFLKFTPHTPRKVASQSLKLLLLSSLLVACVPQDKKEAEDCNDDDRSIASTGDDSQKTCAKPTTPEDPADTAPETKPIAVIPIDSGRECHVDHFKQNSETAKTGKLDILFMMDTSGSMGDDWARVANNVQNLVKQIPATTDVRYAVMLGHVGTYRGKLFSPKNVPVVLDNQKLKTQQISNYLHKTFMEGMKISDSSSGEALFHSLYFGTTKNALANQKLGFFRPDAALSVLFMSDENEIGTFPAIQNDGLPKRCDESFENEVKRVYYTNQGITPNTTYAVVKKLKGDMPLSMHAIVNITKEDVWKRNSKNAKCLYDGLGYGYFDIVSKTQGKLFSIQDNREDGLSLIGAAIRKTLIVNHEFKPSWNASDIDPATLQANVDGSFYPRDYRQITNTVYLAYAGQADSNVEISYCKPIATKDFSVQGFNGQASIHSVSLSWKTPELATHGKVLWGASSLALANELAEAGASTDHIVTVQNLSANTTYFFQAISTDCDGKLKRSDIIQVRTLADVVISPPTDTATATATTTATTTATATATSTSTATATVTATASDTATATQTATATSTATSTDTATSTATATGTNTATATTTATTTAIATDTATATATATTTATSTATATDTGTSTPPNTTWIVQGFDGTTTSTSATLIWQTPGVATNATIRMGTSLSNLVDTATDRSPGETHLLVIDRLTPATTYFIQVVAVDSNGRTVESNIISKKTKAQ